MKQVSVFQDCVGKDEDEGETDNHRLLLLTIPSKERLRRMLAYLFDEEEFFGPYGAADCMVKQGADLLQAFGR